MAEVSERLMAIQVQANGGPSEPLDDDGFFLFYMCIGVEGKYLQAGSGNIEDSGPH